MVTWIGSIKEDSSMPLAHTLTNEKKLIVRKAIDTILEHCSEDDLSEVLTINAFTWGHNDTHYTVELTSRYGVTTWEDS